MSEERRHCERIKVGYKAVLSSGDFTIEGVIEDLSEDGLNVLIYSSLPPSNFNSEAQVTLIFHPGSGETLKLQCKVKWIEKLQPRGPAYRIGMIIIDPPWEESASFL